MDLATKHRPKKIGQFFGNEATIKAIKLLDGRLPPALVLAGPTGCGKTTLARMLKDMAGCSENDFKEYNAANTRGIDTIREIIVESSYAPMRGEIKVYMLDEAHQLTDQAQNALLKILEEPPSHVHFMLCTTNINGLIPTIRSRCGNPFFVSTLTVIEIAYLLQKVCKLERKEVSRKVISRIARSCDGIPRLAVKMLDAVIDIKDEDDAIEAIKEVTFSEFNIPKVFEILTSKSTQESKWNQLRPYLQNFKGNAESVRLQLIGYIAVVMINRPSDLLGHLLECFAENYMNTGKAGLIHDLWVASKA